MTTTTADRLEDATWMADNGENMPGAARRLGLTEDGLERWLRRHGHTELLARLNGSKA